MENNSENILDKLSQIFSNQENIPNEFKELFNNSNNTSNNFNETNNIQLDMDTILKAKRIADSLNSNSNDPRKALLLSLKPYLKEEKQYKVDQYIKFLSISKILEELGPDLFGSDSNAK